MKYLTVFYEKVVVQVLLNQVGQAMIKMGKVRFLSNRLFYVANENKKLILIL